MKANTSPELPQFTKMNSQPSTEETPGYRISKVRKLRQTIRYLAMSKTDRIKAKAASLSVTRTS